MGRIVAGEFVSLDGVVEDPNRLTSRYFNDELGEELGAQMAESGALLMGRVTYEEFVPAWAHKTGEDDSVAAHMSKPKFVVSTTLENTDDWPGSTLIGADVAGRLRALKEEHRADILLTGSATLVRSLLREGLLDELRLLVFPIVIGEGKRLFESGDGGPIGLTLVDSRAFGTGVLSLRYRPEAREE